MYGIYVVLCAGKLQFRILTTKKREQLYIFVYTLFYRMDRINWTTSDNEISKKVFSIVRQIVDMPEYSRPRRN